MKLSIIIPTFNEEKTIETILRKVNEVRLPNTLTREIIVVDDCSTDNTPKILSKLKNIRFKYLRHDKNLGKGSAIRNALKIAKGDYIIIQDADLEYNPEDYSRLFEPILKGKASVVYGTRLTNYPLRLWGKNKTVLPFHLIANKALTALTSFLYGSNLTDMETCYKLIKGEVLQKISLKSQRFDFEPEVTAKILKLNIPIVEVPIVVKPRTYKEGKKISWKDGLVAVWILIKYRL